MERLFPPQIRRRAPRLWRDAVVHSECTLHQLSPYIGKLKSSIARDLIAKYSKPGHLVVDPFAGSGTIPFEAKLSARRAVAFDTSAYAEVLCHAKFNAPSSYADAISECDDLLAEAATLRSSVAAVPQWVRAFFHEKTLREILRFVTVAKKRRAYFQLACLLGILHHQRPGFLSFPASHLTPYLRDKKFPVDSYPELYGYRPLRPRLIAKIERTYKRPPQHGVGPATFHRDSIETADIPIGVDAVITSPPYMNALDYVRDNRLRLWFLDEASVAVGDAASTRRVQAFRDMIATLATKVEGALRSGGYCVLIIGDHVKRSGDSFPSKMVAELVATHAPALRLERVITDAIPDIRRARRELRGTKNEHVLVFRKETAQ